MTKSKVKAVQQDTKSPKKEDEDVLTQEEFKAIAELVSPTPILDEDGIPVQDESGNLKYKEVDPDEVKYINDVLFSKKVTVGLVIQLSTLFVNNLRQFTINNFQGLMDTQEIQKRIAHEIGATKEIEDKVVNQFNKEVSEQEKKTKAQMKKANADKKARNK